MFKWAADHPDAAAAIAIAAVSLGFSAFVFWRQTSLQERVTRIEEERREEERRSQQRADVTVECSSRGERSRVAHTLLDYFLVLHNRGPAVARNVSTEPPGGKRGALDPHHREGEPLPQAMWAFDNGLARGDRHRDGQRCGRVEERSRDPIGEDFHRPSVPSWDLTG